MEEQSVSYQVAVLAKEKGFNLKTIQFFGTHYKTGEVTESGTHENSYHTPDAGYKEHKHLVVRDFVNHNDPSYEGMAVRRVSKPTQALLQRWLRETHKQNIEVLLNSLNKFNVSVKWLEHIYINENHNPKSFNSYEEALEEGLSMGLTLIK